MKTRSKTRGYQKSGITEKNEPVLIFPLQSSHSVPITLSDIERLDSYEYLNDSLIDFWLRKDPSNQFCADCHQPSPEWVSINTGAFVCIDCGGMHRRFGSHISKVRSLLMDGLSPCLVSWLSTLPNCVVNSIYEEIEKPEFPKPTSDSDSDKRQQYLKAKYVDKLFVAPFSENKPIHEALFDAIMARNTVRVLKLFAQGARADHVYEGKYLLQVIVEEELLIMVEAVILNGANVNTVDQNGRSPLFYAVEKGNLEMVQLLVGYDADLLLKDKDGNDPANFLQILKEKSQVLCNVFKIKILVRIKGPFLGRFTEFQTKHVVL